MKTMTAESYEWVRCPRCKHKLFKVVGTCPELRGIETKCSSCGEIIEFIKPTMPLEGPKRSILAIPVRK